MIAAATLRVALEAHPAWLDGAVLVLGLVVGSFLNVVIHRLPAILEQDWTRHCRELLGEPAQVVSGVPGLAFPPSHCPHCHTPIKARDNIPVLSFLWLKGRCRYCHERISWRYPAFEIITGVLSASVAQHFGFGLHTLAALGLTWALIALAGIDLECQLLPDAITLPLLWAGLLVNTAGLFTNLSGAVWGAATGYGTLWILFHLFRKITGKDGMGHGDFKLFAVGGAWLGWIALPFVILAASFAGAVVGLTLITLKRHDRDAPIPFGPFLCAAIWIGLLWNGPILAAYLRLGR
ncbi:MAG: prepilin peptidase [Acidiferrobacteraceae bacterium]